MAYHSGPAAFSMRSLLSVIGLSIVASPSLVSAYNNVKFINHCPYDVFSWTVGPAGSNIEGKDHEAVTIPANSVTLHGMFNAEAVHGGIAIKLRDIPIYQVAPAGSVQVEYNLEPSRNNLSYDLSTIDCNHNAGPESASYCPLIAGGIKVGVEKADQERCPAAWCDADGCHNVYKGYDLLQGVPTFRCDAGTDILVEVCTERAGPRTFNGHFEPGHPVDPDVKPGNATTNGVCGAKTPGGATCFGYAHGSCCSSYGWCGDSEAHCGDGCQAGFGNCLGQPVQPPAYSPPTKPSSVYQPPAQSSTIRSTSKYTRPSTVSRPAYNTPSSAYSVSVVSYVPPTYTHVGHTWPSYSKPTSLYAKPSTVKSTPAYSKPTNSRSTFVYSPPVPSYSKPTPVYSKPTPSYSKPSTIKSTPCHKPTTTSKVVYSTPSAAYSKPTPPYSAPLHTTIYATHTITEIRAPATKTVTVSIGTEYPVYNAPTPSTAYYTPPSSTYRTPSPMYSAPTHAHTSQQEPSIPSSWYSKTTLSSVYSAHTLTEVSYDAPTPSSASYATGPVYYPPARA